jgi:D-alanyl-D-alanine carboxypeptidase
VTNPASLLLIAALSLSTGCASTLFNRVEPVVDSAVATQLAERKFQGVVLVRHRGQTVLRKAYGFADLEQQVAHTAASRFMIMSVSKQFTAALIARLVAQGKLSFDDPVALYLDHWPEAWRDVTVGHLLSHSSGLDVDTTYFWLVKHRPEFWAEPGVPPPPYEPRPLLAPAGSTYRYANVGYTLLTLIAERAAKEPFDVLMRREVFAPLGLRDTEPVRAGSVIKRVRGYRRTPDGLALDEQGTIDIVGAGDLVSSVDDIARFNEAFDRGAFLPPAITSRMLTVHVAGPRAGLGYGWFIRAAEGRRLIQYHTGSGAGFRAFNYRIPHLQLTLTVLSNIGIDDGTWVPAMLEEVASVLERP